MRLLPDGAEEIDMDISVLEGLPLFDSLTSEERDLIAQHAREVDFPEGATLVSDGALAWDFYVVREGTAEVRHGPTPLRTLGPGDFFGEIGVLAGDRRRTATVVATSPMRTIRLTTHQVRMIAQQLPEIEERLRAAVAEREQHLL